MIPFLHLRLGGDHGNPADWAGSPSTRRRVVAANKPRCAIHALIGFEPMARALASLYPSAMGEKAWAPLAMRKALLLAPGTIFPISNSTLALEERASLRRFCGFARDEGAQAHG
jgi:hypothetical protein